MFVSLHSLKSELLTTYYNLISLSGLQITATFNENVFISVPPDAYADIFETFSSLKSFVHQNNTNDNVSSSMINTDTTGFLLLPIQCNKSVFAIWSF